MADRETIKSELAAKFAEFQGEGSNDLLEACGDIGEYLSSEPMYAKGLSAFEKRLADTLGEKYQPATEYYRKMRKYWKKLSSRGGAQHARRPEKVDAVSHVVTNELRRVEKHAGFTSASMVGSESVSVVDRITPRDAAPILLGFAHYDLFRAQVSAGQVWKDPSVSNGHGENTHRIQWYLICADGVVKSGAMAGKPCDVYKAVGGIILPQNRKFGLWDALVDRGDVTSAYFPAESDARSPEFLMSYIQKNNDRFPLLAAYLSARDTKPFRLNKEYLADKIFGERLGNLDKADAELVDMIYEQYRDKTILIIPETGRVVLDPRTDHIS